MRLDGVPAEPGCISAVWRTDGDTTHIFLNFCGRNGVDECIGRPRPYVSLVLPTAEFAPGFVGQASGGRVSATFADQEFQVVGQPGRPIPLQLEIKRHADASTPEGVLRAELRMLVPARFRGGRMLSLHATTN